MIFSRDPVVLTWQNITITLSLNPIFVSIKDRTQGISTVKNTHVRIKIYFQTR